MFKIGGWMGKNIYFYRANMGWGENVVYLSNKNR